MTTVANKWKLEGSSPTYTNMLCEWMVITMKDNKL